MAIPTSEQTRAVVQKHGAQQGKILDILLELQYSCGEGYVPQETAAVVAQELGLSETRVYEVLSYYAMLKTKPQARHVLKVCNNSPCHFSGSTQVAQMLEEMLGVPIGQTTPDGLFAFHYIPCVGACEIGPVIKLKDEVYGNLNRGKIAGLLAELRTREQQA